jgi:hypothetical protein
MNLANGQVKPDSVYALNINFFPCSEKAGNHAA